jgi:hypothetical protein
MRVAYRSRWSTKGKSQCKGEPAKVATIVGLLGLALSVQLAAQNEVTSSPITKQDKEHALAQEQTREHGQKSQKKEQKHAENAKEGAEKRAEVSEEGTKTAEPTTPVSPLIYKRY